MANGHSIIPVNQHQLADKALIEFLAEDMVFIPDNLPWGRFPTLKELRQSIHELGYDLKEENDWYVTSEDDHTEIWFKSKSEDEDIPVEFWFRRGDVIVLDITQAISNRCGSFVVIDHSGSPAVLIVPDTLFPTVTLSDRHFVTVISQRITIMIEQLAEASREKLLFLLSQIRQALRRLDYLRQYEIFRIAEQGVATFSTYLNHEDARIRFLAFDLVATFKQQFYEYSKVLMLSIKNEPNANIKFEMINAIEHLVVPSWIGGETDPWTKALLDQLVVLNNDANEPQPIRLATSSLIARAQPGFLSPTMRMIFIDALARPEQYEPSSQSPYSTIEKTLKSTENLLLNHRIEILVEALPQMPMAQYAHEVLRALLDTVFFGAIHATQMSSGLLDEQPAERPSVDEARFSNDLPRVWLYPANPTKLNASELLPMQRKVLEMAIELDIPWMVHSNLLEKYGLPPTRAGVRDLLDASQ